MEINVKDAITSVTVPHVYDIEDEDTVTINIPKTQTDINDVPVTVNDRTWLIPRGEDVTVPDCVAEVLQKKAEYDSQN